MLDEDNFIKSVVNKMLTKNDYFANSLVDFMYIMEKFTCAYRVRDIIEDENLTDSEKYEKIKKLAKLITDYDIVGNNNKQ